MSIDLIFSQPLAQNPPTGIYSDKLSPPGGDRSAGTQTVSGSAEDGRENFVNTLKQATRSQYPARQREHAGESQPEQPRRAVADGKTEDACDHKLPPVEESIQIASNEHPDPTTTGWNLTAFMRLLESLGFKNTAEVCHCAIWRCELRPATIRRDTVRSTRTLSDAAPCRQVDDHTVLNGQQRVCTPQPWPRIPASIAECVLEFEPGLFCIQDDVSL